MNKKKFKKTIALLLALTMVPQFIMYGSAMEVQPHATAAKPQAYFFVYDNGSSFDSQASASNTILSYLWNSGFGAGSYINNKASTIASVIQQKEVTVIVSGGYYSQTVLPGKSTTTYIHVHRKHTEYDPTAFPVGTYDFVLSDLTVNPYVNRKSNLVILASQYSANSIGRVAIGNSQAINLCSVMEAMRNTITDCTIGWEGVVNANTEEMALWIEKFFSVTNSQTISGAFDFANGWLEMLHNIGSQNTGYSDIYLERIYTRSRCMGEYTNMITG